MDDEQKLVCDYVEVIKVLQWSVLVSYMSNTGIKTLIQTHHSPQSGKFPDRLHKVMDDLDYLMSKNLPQTNLNSTLKKVLTNKSAKSRRNIIPSDTSFYIFKVEQHLIAYLRDIPQMLWEHGTFKLDLQLITIQMLKIVQNNIYILDYDQNMNYMLQIICLLSLREGSLQIMLDSIELESAINLLFDHYFFGQNQWNPESELLLTILCQFSTHFQYVNQTISNIDLIIKVLQCYKYGQVQDQRQRKQMIQLDLLVDEIPDEEEYKRLGLQELYKERLASRKKKLIDLDDDQNKLQQLFLIPGDMNLLLMATMASFPYSICDLDIDDKWDLHLQTQRYTTVFHVTLSFKILQALAVDMRYRCNYHLARYNLIENIQRYMKIFDFFTVTREAIRVINNLLFSIDDTILWLKFDSCNLENENSNFIKFKYKDQVQLKVVGKPTKLQNTAGLYLEGCGADFGVENGLEIVGQTNDYTIHKTLLPGLQLPEENTVSFWFVYFSKKTQKNRHIATTGEIRTLLGCSDGQTPYVFADTAYMLFGVTNIGGKEKAKELGIELQSVGLKFFNYNMEKSKKVFQGWNQVVITIDNKKCLCTLYVNGIKSAKIQGIYCYTSLKYIGNNSSGQENFGYVCDLRIYPRILTDEQIKFLCLYDKTVKMICNSSEPDAKSHIDILSQINHFKILNDLRKIIQENQYENPEACIVALECVSLMCYASTRMRLESTKLGIFEMVSTMVQSEDFSMSYFAKQVIISIR